MAQESCTRAETAGRSNQGPRNICSVVNISKLTAGRRDNGQPHKGRRLIGAHVHQGAHAHNPTCLNTSLLRVTCEYVCGRRTGCAMVPPLDCNGVVSVRISCPDAQCSKACASGMLSRACTIARLLQDMFAQRDAHRHNSCRVQRQTACRASTAAFRLWMAVSRLSEASAFSSWTCKHQDGYTALGAVVS